MTKETLPKLPRSALRFLHWFCPPQLAEGIEGDLIQQFEEEVVSMGVRRARLHFSIQVLRFFSPGIILRNKFSFYLINTIMLRSYFVVAFRNIMKNRVFSFINVFGLSVGLAASMLIFQFVTFELSYDRFHAKFDRIYRVTNDRFQNGKLIQHGTIMYPTIGPTMARDYAEIEEYSRLMPGGTLNVRIGEKSFRGDNFHFADEHFFSVFSFPLIAGDRATLLKDSYSIVLSEETARKYFEVNDQNYSKLIGKLIMEGLDPQPFKVTGICANVAENSHLQFDALISYSTLIRPNNQDADNSWTWSDMRHYLVLKEGASYKELESKFETFSERYFQGDKVSGSVEKFYLQPLNRAHLYSDYEYDVAKRSSGKAVWGMVAAAIFILFIAWINYVNLTTSRAIDRAKEVGLRKVMGAYKSQLVRQFIFESVIISLVSLGVALLIMQVSQGQFNQVIGGNLSWWSVLASLDLASGIIVALVLLGGILISGFYPAFVLSSYQPVTVLKGKFHSSSKGQFLRRTLVVLQFGASAVLITGTLIISSQLQYVNNADLGINIKNTMIVSSPELTAYDSTFIPRVEAFKYELTQIDGVITATTIGRIPGARLGRTFGIRLSDQPSDAHYTMSWQNIDHHFFDVYQVPVVAGRKFLVTDHKINGDDINTLMINESAVKLLGISTPDEAVGKQLVWGRNGTRLWTIVGVMQDFHQESFRSPKEPMVFRPAYSTFAPTSIRVEKDKVQPIIADVELLYRKFFPGNSFEYFFLEDNFKNQYQDDNRFGKVVTIFTVLGIIISCMGLIALSSFTAAQRTKEIGIRKVLGASVRSIVTLLSADFIRLVLVAAVISLPVAYLTMESWLSGYTYRVAMGWGMFVVPVLIIVLIATATVSFQVLKTAMTSPAQTLKYE